MRGSHSQGWSTGHAAGSGVQQQDAAALRSLPCAAPSGHSSPTLCRSGGAWTPAPQMLPLPRRTAPAGRAPTRACLLWRCAGRIIQADVDICACWTQAGSLKCVVNLGTTLGVSSSASHSLVHVFNGCRAGSAQLLRVVLLASSSGAGVAAAAAALHTTTGGTRCVCCCLTRLVG